MSSRDQDLDRFYELMADLRERVGGYRTLAEANGRMPWPSRGVYFFFDSTQTRNVGDQLRVVRVGTHAVTYHSRTTLWDRLRQHRGEDGGKGGGNHRGSVFRKLVGEALANSSGVGVRPWPSTWGVGSSAPRHVRLAERLAEEAVSKYISQLPFLWVAVNDAPGPESYRADIERHAVALLSNYAKTPLDQPSPDWLGTLSPSAKVRESELWNNNYVDYSYDPTFVDLLKRFIRLM